MSLMFVEKSILCSTAARRFISRRIAAMTRRTWPLIQTNVHNIGKIRLAGVGTGGTITGCGERLK